MPEEPILSPEEILKQYASGPAQLKAALEGLAEKDLDLTLPPDPSGESWTIRQYVHHVADGDDIWDICVKAALGNQEGSFTLQWYWEKPQVEWAKNWKYADRGIESSLELLTANRRHIVELVQGDADAWEKSIRIQWPKREEGCITLGNVIEMQARHLAGHINDIQNIQKFHNV